MKKITLLLVLISLTGCSSMLVKRTPELIRDAQTNIVQVVQTNTVQREVWTTNTVQIASQRTNDAGIVLPPVFQLQPVQQLQAAQIFMTNFTPVVTPAIWFTNLSLAAPATGLIQGAGELAPVPWGGLAAQGLTALLGVGFAVYNWFGKRRAEKEAGVQKDLKETAHEAVDLLVQNVDQVRAVALQIPGYTEKIDANVMRAIKVVQVAAGSDVKNLIANSVDENTTSLSKIQPAGVVV